MLAVATAVGTFGFGAQAQVAGQVPCANPAASPSASPSASPTSSPVASPTVTCEPGITATAAAATAVAIETRDFAFTPNQITVAANTKVAITIKNIGMLPHDFYIDALGIKSNVMISGGSTTVTFTAPPGTYQFYCSQRGHKAAGMVGTLIVK
jgi:plastocyanin